MKNLQVIKLKPNPAGRDRSIFYTPPSQLAAEWVDFKNNGNESYDLNGVALYHIAYQVGCTNGRYDKIQSFQGVLAVGQTIRVHSGKPIPMSQINAQDQMGADIHLFTHSNYVWNNDCGDTASLWHGQTLIDKASYRSYPTEGKILLRQGDMLI